MEIELNGEPFTYHESGTIASLLEIKALNGRRVAVMVNDAIVKKARFEETRLQPGDRVEIIQMVGGG